MKLSLIAVLGSSLLIGAFLFQNPPQPSPNCQIRVLAQDESPAEELRIDSLIIAVQTQIPDQPFNDRKILKMRRDKMFKILQVSARFHIWSQARFLEGVDTMFLFVRPKDAEVLAHAILRSFPEIGEIREDPLRDDGPPPHLLGKVHSQIKCFSEEPSYPKICK